MNDGFVQLLEKAGLPLIRQTPQLHAIPATVSSSAVEELSSLLTCRNGFYAFQDALHVFPAGDSESHIGFAAWNNEQLWRSEYDEDMVRELACFAEDTFGNQFCLYSGGIAFFDAETGEVEPFAASLSAWATTILDDPERTLCAHVARAWATERSPLRTGNRLVPTLPFVMGGTSSLDNLYELNAVAAMRLRGDIARQIRNLPDGTEVVISTR
jgi:hypothetical protein